MLYVYSHEERYVHTPQEKMFAYLRKSVWILPWGMYLDTPHEEGVCVILREKVYTYSHRKGVKYILL